jgi:pyruvate, orthophosphate dikinase
VGYEKLVCKEREKECMISGIRMVSGDYISINGQKGTVYKGTLPII